MREAQRGRESGRGPDPRVSGHAESHWKGPPPVLLGTRSWLHDAGVFVVSKDELIAYVEYKGYTAVMYTGGKNGEQPTGWVLSSRLQATGTGISPKP